MTSSLRLTLIGGPTVLIETRGARLLTDPTFDLPQRYQGQVVLEKLRGPALSAAELPPVDAVLLSHDQHLDNLDHGGRSFVGRSPITLTTEVGARRLGAPAKGLAPWASHLVTSQGGTTLRVTATPARHGPRGIEPIAGEVIGFVVSTLEGRDLLYFSGDTCWYEGVAEVARRFDPALVLVCAGSAKPRGPFHVTMDNNDLVETAAAFPRAKIASVHNEGWAHFTETEADFRTVFQTLGLGDRVLPLARGAAVELPL